MDLSPAHCDELPIYVNGLIISNDDELIAEVEDVLREVQSLESRQRASSRFRRLIGHLEPLIEFLIMYSPAVDMLVQYDVSPSAVVWGSLKTLIKASGFILPEKPSVVL